MTGNYQEYFALLAQTLKKKRLEVGFTQTQLGEITKRPQSAIAKIENLNTGDVQVRIVYELAQGIGIGMAELFQEIDSLQVISNDKADHWEKMKASVDTMEKKDREWFANLIQHCIAKPL